MKTGEIADYGRRRNRRRMLLIGAGAAGALALALFLWSPSGDPQEFKLGSACDKDCGSSSVVGWLCINPEQGERYCSRPCGGVNLACPDEMECEEARAEEAGADATDYDRAAMYCYLDGPSRLELAPTVIEYTR